MSPLVASPNRGYADWQRVSNADSGILINATLVASGVAYNSSIVDVSRYEFLAGRISCTAGAQWVEVTWYADAQGTVIQGQRIFTMDAVVGDPIQLRMPNLGSFVQVTINTLATPTYSAVVQLFGSDRYAAVEMIPIYPMLFEQQTATLGSGISTEIYPLDYYSGPIRFNLQSLPGGMNYTIEYLWIDAAYKVVDSIAAPAGTVSWSTMSPPGFWKLVISNTSAANSTYIVSATPSLTGSL